LWWGFFAESVTGRVWAGQYVMTVTNQAFSRCYSTGVGGEGGAARRIGFAAS
jgi:hypothetical protein